MMLMTTLTEWRESLVRAALALSPKAFEDLSKKGKTCDCKSCFACVCFEIQKSKDKA